MKVGSGMAAVYSNYIGKNDIDNFPASGYTFKELLRLRMWRNGRRTSLRSWRATVQVQVLSPALISKMILGFRVIHNMSNWLYAKGFLIF